MVTAFGKELRKIRLNNDELLKDMADRLEITAAYLSSIENGKKKPNYAFVKNVCNEYSLNNDESIILEDSYYRTIEEISFSTSKMNSNQFDVGLILARKLNELDSEQIDNILSILNNLN